MAKASARRASGPGFGSLVKFGFGIGVGSALAMLIFLALGIGLFLWGWAIYKKETKKAAKDQNKSRKILGIVLMVLGCIIGLGLGFPAILEAVGDMV
jgi:uncharacterized iron-regulated membrane protein